MKIITISGKAQHGKDLSATILKEQLEQKGKKVLIVHQADYLKFICKEYFGWDGNKDEKGRNFLQETGTDKIRTRDCDFHVKILEIFINVFQYDYDYFIIADVRFPNEITYFEDRGYEIYTMKVNRLNFENSLTEEQRNHASEIALDDYEFDHYLYAESGRNNLEKVICTLIRRLEYD